MEKKEEYAIRLTISADRGEYVTTIPVSRETAKTKSLFYELVANYKRNLSKKFRIIKAEVVKREMPG